MNEDQLREVHEAVRNHCTLHQKHVGWEDRPAASAPEPATWILTGTVLMVVMMRRAWKRT